MLDLFRFYILISALKLSCNHFAMPNCRNTYIIKWYELVARRFDQEFEFFKVGRYIRPKLMMNF